MIARGEFEERKSSRLVIGRDHRIRQILASRVDKYCASRGQASEASGLESAILIVPRGQ